jgi:hypothetical protein
MRDAASQRANNLHVTVQDGIGILGRGLFADLPENEIRRGDPAILTPRCGAAVRDGDFGFILGDQQEFAAQLQQLRLLKQRLHRVRDQPVGVGMRQLQNGGQRPADRFVGAPARELLSGAIDEEQPTTGVHNEHGVTDEFQRAGVKVEAGGRRFGWGVNHSECTGSSGGDHGQSSHRHACPSS